MVRKVIPSPAKKQQNKNDQPNPATITNEELAQLQATEVEVLQSILGDDFCKLDTDVASAWGQAARGATASTADTSHASTFQITLRPDTDSLKALVFATARFRLPIRYPLLPPIISVLTGSKTHKGLTDDHIKSLQAALTNKAKELAGAPTEILWEVISIAQEHISKHNLEYFAGPNRSLEEEKQLREVQRRTAERKVAQQERQRRTKEEEERATKIAQLIREQSERNTAAMQQVLDRKRDASALSPSDTQLASYLDEQGYGRGASSLSTLDDLNVPSGSSKKTEFFMNPIDDEGSAVHRLHVGPLLEKNALYSSYIVESAQASTLSTNLSWQMDEYRIQAPYYDLSSGKKAIEEVEWELDKLRNVRCDSLVNVKADSLIANATVDGKPTARRLLVVHDLIRGMSTEALLSHGVQLPWSRVRFYLRDLAGALDALHSRNLVHRNVHIANVFLDGQPSKLATAKLARAGYAQRLRDMNAVHALIESSDAHVDDCSAAAEAELPSKWDAPCEQEHSSSTSEQSKQEDGGGGGGGGRRIYTRKRDIWQLGVVALQMLFGSDVVKRYPSAGDLLNNADQLLDTLSAAHVVALLRALLDPSARKRPTASELRARLDETIRYEDEELAGSASHLSSTLDSETGAHKVEAPKQRPFLRTTSERRENPFRPGSFWQLGRTRMGGNDSRYENDFEELELLGKGAYGAVFRARNRLDGRDYAIKKIRLSASAENDEKTLREITALSRLSHQNIVRYVTCWIQTQDDAMEAPSSMTDGTVLSSLQTGTQEDVGAVIPGINDDFMSYGHDAFSHSASHIRFGNDESESSDDSHAEAQQRTSAAKNKQGDDDDAASAAAQSDKSSSSSSSSEDNSDVHDVQASRMHQSFSVSNALPTSSRPRWLFIQMEFVENQTLREAIDRGLSIDESWRLFRQMLEALAHVSSLGIIHRDLKPSNILMFRSNEASGLGGVGDANGGAAATSSASSGSWELKIGDFGLATTTTTNQGAMVLDGLQSGFGTQDEIVEQTTDVGTNLYIAPEVLKAGTLRYDHKVDVYAAGVVFFEMLASQRVYKTGMERIQILRDLRLPDVRFPAAWDEGQFPAQTKILRKMLNHNPAERPSPLELLKSDLLPPKMEDEYIAECMRLLSMPNSTYNLQLMESLFETKETFEEREARDFTFDAGSNEGQGLDNRFIGVASHHLRSFFHRRGAVELEAPLLLPPNELYTGDQQKPVELLDRTGKIVQLPHDLLVPFARMVAHGEQDRFKRYAIAPVYRPNLLAGGQPRSVLEVDFDIVAPEKTPAAEAEVLGVVDEILEELPGFTASEWVIQISHGTVLDLLLDRIPKHRRAQVFAAIGKLNSTAKSTATQGRVLLSSLNLPRSITDELDGANLSDDVDVVFDKLQRIVAHDLRPKLTRAVQEIRQVIEAAQQFGVQRPFLFTPLLVTNASFYRENVFFVVSRGRGKRKDVLASGGRYDALLKRFASPTLAKPPSHAVGIQIALGRIAVALAKHHEFISNSGDDRQVGSSTFTPRRCDVYVASASGLLARRIEICRELWSANISADLSYEYALEESPELLASTCRAEGISFLVIARARSSMVKVKAIASRTEHEVHRWELCSWIADRLQRLRGTQTDVSAINAVNVADRSVIGASGGGGGGALVGGGSGGGGSGGVGGGVGVGGGSSTLGTLLQQQAGDVDVILPERQQDKRRADKHGFNDTRRGRKQAHLAPLQENAVKQVAKLLEELTGGNGSVAVSTKLTIIAVDVSITAGSTSPAAANQANVNSAGLSTSFGAMQVSAAATMSGQGGGVAGTSPFTLLSAAALARTDDGLWKTFVDCLSTDEREYGKQLRRRLSNLSRSRRAWLVSVRSEGAVSLI